MFATETINGKKVEVDVLNFLKLMMCVEEATVYSKNVTLLIVSKITMINGKHYSYEFWCDFSDFEIINFVLESTNAQTQSLGI